ncbi:MAG: hypothetical protein KF690_05230 [Bacteroidetes bacterium]|nr:hypothetical protein [Bacteroidota bacterium]
MKPALYIILFLALLPACSRRSLSDKEYIKATEQAGNGLRSVKEIDGIVYSLQYKPLDYVILLDHPEETLTATALDSLRKEYGGMQYFSLRISARNGTKELLKERLRSGEEYQQRVLYCMDGMKQDIRLREQEGHTYRCALFHFVRSFDVAPYADFVLGFPRPDHEIAAVQKGEAPAYRDKTLILEDKLFNNGIIKLAIKGEEIEDHPKLATYAK